MDLVSTARRALLERGFLPDFPKDARDELPSLGGRAAEALGAPGVRDLTGLLWSSIDNDESRDLDQIEVAEQLPGGDIRVLVGVADVDALVHKGSALDARAAVNTTSIYTGVATFPMLPEALSCGLTSLNPDVERLAVVLELVVRPDGSLKDEAVYRAKVRNHAQLAYDELAGFLAGEAPVPARVGRVQGLEGQLRLQNEAAQRLKALRHQHGALELDTIEARPVARDGEVVALELARKGRSRELIEDFMIAANGVMARFLLESRRPALARVVKTPERWDRIAELAHTLGDALPDTPSPTALSGFLARQKAKDPLRFPDVSLAVVKLLGPGEYIVRNPNRPAEGHFGLAVQDYTHSTAPNRRFADLVTQRLLKAVLAGAPSPYAEAELGAIAAHCTQKEDDERKVERFMRKVAAAELLSPRVGETFEALVTGKGPKGTFVRLISPPAEGRVVRGESGMDVGDRVLVKLLSTTPEKGFIDFGRA